MNIASGDPSVVQVVQPTVTILGGSQSAAVPLDNPADSPAKANYADRKLPGQFRKRYFGCRRLAAAGSHYADSARSE